MKPTIKSFTGLALASFFSATSFSQANFVIAVAADTANSSSTAFGSQYGGLFTDGFTYDALSPTSDSPTMFLGPIGNYYHGSQYGDSAVLNGTNPGAKGGGTSGDINHTLSFTTDGGAFTTSSAAPTIVIDLWGRMDGNGSTWTADAGGVLMRDDNLTVTLYNGDYLAGSIVGSAASLGIANPPLPLDGSETLHTRASFAVGSDVTFDRFQITSTDTYFSLAEVRVAAISEAVIAVTTDTENSSSTAFGSQYGGLFSGTKDDASMTFTYDPLDPTSDSPGMFQIGLAEYYHGSQFGDSARLDGTNSGSAKGNGTSGNIHHTLSFTTDGGAQTTSASDPTIVVDLWGRMDGGSGTWVSDPAGVLLRDDNLTITLYNGDYLAGSIVGSAASLGIDNPPFTLDGTENLYKRASFLLGAGVTFDRFQITSTDSYFTLSEVRVATLPDPSASLLLEIAQSGGNLDFEWNSQPGMQYDLVSASDLSTPVSTWAVYDDGVTVYTDIASAGATTTLIGVLRTGPVRFFALVEEVAP